MELDENKNLTDIKFEYYNFLVFYFIFYYR